MAKQKNNELYYFPERLTKRLDRILDFPLTLVEAPSGAGKTTAVREYMAEKLPRRVNQYWYTAIGETAVRAWEHICALIAHVDNNTASALTRLGVPSYDTLGDVARLMQNCRCDVETVLVIDNYQMIDSSIPREIISALSYIGSSFFHIVIITQELHMGSFYSTHNHRILTVGKEELFFERADIDEFFRQAGFLLTPTDLESITRYTEGWVAALQLQMITYRDTGGFENATNIMPLVRSAIWNRLDGDEQLFLLSLSLLDSFTAHQACVMLDKDKLPPYAEALLETGSFLRYNHLMGEYMIHSLLQEFLRVQFEKEPIELKKKLWKRAGTAVAQRGLNYKAAGFYYLSGDFEALLSLPLKGNDLTGYLETDISRFFTKILDECPHDTLLRYPVRLLVFAFHLFLVGDYIGGVVTANAIGGAGSYSNSPDNGAFTMNGNAVVIASSVSDNSPKAKGILFIGNSGVMYGNVTVEQDLTIPNNRILVLRTGTLTIAKGVTVTNNGIIVLGEGSSILNSGDTYGTLTGGGKTQNMVSIPEIKGVPAPVPGEVPVTIVTESSHYTGTVQWSPAHKVFQAGVGYTATITLTAKPYFVFTGVPANFFTLMGASSVKNNVDSGVVTAVFSATDTKNNCFDLSDGPIRVENGSSFNTMKIKYGKGLVKDYLSPNTPITITGNYLGDSNSNVDAIYVSQAANIKMNNVNISVNASNRSAFNIDGGSVTLELIGENILKSGSNAAGLRVPAKSSLTINGNGSLTSTGDWGGAGIGGNPSEACGAVTINGGVITTQGGSNAMGIGRGSGSSNGGTLTMNGDAIVFASSLSDNSPKTKGILFNGNSGMMYGDVMVEHDVTVSNNMRLVLNTGTLTIAAGNTLTNNGIILLGDGTSILYGSGTYGTLAGSGQTQNMVTITEILGVEAPVPGAVPVTTITETSQYTGTVKWLPAHNVFQKGTSYTATITLTAKPGFVLTGVPANFFKVPGATALNSADSGVITAVFSATNVSNSIFDITGGAIRIEKGTNTDTFKVLCGGSLVKDNISKETQVTITGSCSNISGDGIYVAPGVTANIMLCNANINASCAFNMSGAIVNLELVGENSLRSNSDSAGLRVPVGASVTVYGEGKLTVNGSGWGAGIGGNPGESGGNITLNSGMITVYGGSFGAGIGGGDNGSGGNITINNGTISATSGNTAAGIGGGDDGTAGTIIINGGIITANGGSYGPGIGNDFYGTGKDVGSVTINGGMISVNSIGNGVYNGPVCSIAINGGTVSASRIGGTGGSGSSPDNGSFTMNGNAIVFASSVSDSSPKTKGILFIGNSGTVYGNVTLEENTTIPSGKTLTIPNNSSLIIPEEVTLTNNGIITPSNGSTMTVSGLVSGKKIDGANVTALLANKITHNSVTLNAADLLASTGQSVEYAFSTSNFVPSSGWQNTPHFTALNPGTTYYFFARSREDTNFRAGITSSLPVTLAPTHTITGYISPDFFSSSNETTLKEGFNIEVLGTDISTTTKSDGSFQISNVPQNPNNYTVRISKPGYLTRDIKNIIFNNSDIKIGSMNSPVILWAGDVNQDNSINMLDAMEMIKTFNTNSISIDFNKDYDFNKDNCINILDIMILAKHFSQTTEDYLPITI